jgi:hypothetical protein
MSNLACCLVAIITAALRDLNGIEFVSRDVAWMAKSARDQAVGSIAR